MIYNTETNDNLKVIRKIMFRLLPVQILLAASGAVNGIISSYYATNYVGIDAMSAIGLYSPLNMLVGAVGAILAGGTAIICGKYLGKNEHERLQNVFSLDLFLTIVVSLLFTAVIAAMGLFSLTGLFTDDAMVRLAFNRYLIGQAIGILPLLIANQLPAFLTMENQSRRALYATVIFIAANLGLNILFVQVLRMEALGLALASSIGMWIFLIAEISWFCSPKSVLKISFRNIAWKEWTAVFAIGFPGAATYLYQTARGMAVNGILQKTAGAAGLSAFSAANSLLNIFWAVPAGMIAVSRLLISSGAGEENRLALTNTMRAAMYYFVPLQFAVSLGIVLTAGPLTSLFYRDPSSEVFILMRTALRILPFCMPFSVICNHFTCFGQTMDRHVFVNILSLLDGVISVVVFSVLLMPVLGYAGVSAANILNGVVTTLYIYFYGWYKRKAMPHSVAEVMALPDGFGVPEENRIGMIIRNMDDVIRISEMVQKLCLKRNIDAKRSLYAALALEEMAGNIVLHGFTKDNKTHIAEAYAAVKDNTVILKTQDDCPPFNPRERSEVFFPDDPLKNIGIRMIFSITNDTRYQYVLGMNMVTTKL